MRTRMAACGTTRYFFSSKEISTAAFRKKMAWSPTRACMPRFLPSRASSLHGSSSSALRSATGVPGPVATMRPVWTCCESMAVAGRYRPTRVRSSPSSGVISTRSPTTISCFLGNSTSSVSIAGLGLVHGNQLKDPELAHLRWQAEADLVPDPAVGQGAAQRRRQRDVAGVDIHHLGQHYHIGVGIVGVEIEYLDPRAEAHPIGRGLGVGELAQLVEPLVQLAQARLDELLALQGCLVFAVLPQVAQLDRLGDGLRQQDVQFMAELLDLAAQLLPHLTDHWSNRTIKKRRPRAAAALRARVERIDKRYHRHGQCGMRAVLTPWRSNA